MRRTFGAEGCHRRAINHPMAKVEDEERAEVVVEAVEVEVVDHGRGPHDPGVGPAGVGIATLLGAEDRCLLLRLAPGQTHLICKPLAVKDLGIVLPRTLNCNFLSYNNLRT